jgi:hypothetical protein
LGFSISKKEFTMRKLFMLVAAASLLLGTVGAASAAPLNWAGTSSTLLGDLPEVLVLGGGVATVNNSSGILPAHLSTLRLKGSRGGVAGTVTVLITDPDTEGNGIAAVIVAAQAGTGTLGGISGAVASTGVLTRNQLPVRGVSKICLITTTCDVFLELVLTQPTTVNGVPGSAVIGVGVGGLITVGAGTNTIRISVQGAPWTVKTITAVDHITTINLNTTFVTVSAKGFAHGPGSATSSNTAALSGVVQIVTPVQIVTNLQLGSSKKLSGSISLLIHFIPEPGLLVLLGSGVVGLALLGSRRMRK